MDCWYGEGLSWVGTNLRGLELYIVDDIHRSIRYTMYRRCFGLQHPSHMTHRAAMRIPLVILRRRDATRMSEITHVIVHCRQS